MSDPDGRRMQRRGALASLGALAAAAATGRTGDSPADERQHAANARGPGADPRTSAEGQIKMTATLDGSPSYWGYEGYIYAVRAHERPRAILAVAGCQAQWAQRQDDGSYHLAANLLTFFRDPDSGEYLEHYDNPFTGTRLAVSPNIFSGGGHAVYPADGGSMRIGGQFAASQSAPQGFKPADSTRALGRVAWSLSADLVTLANDQAFDVRLQPQLESQTRTAQRSAFFDRRVKRLPARFSASTITPWLAWMQMGDAEGHLVWHTAGEKHFSLQGLADHYRHHAAGLIEQLAHPPSFEGSR